MRKPITRDISSSKDTTILENQKAADLKNAPAEQAKSTRGAEGKLREGKRKKGENDRGETPKETEEAEKGNVSILGKKAHAKGCLRETEHRNGQ